MRMDWGEYVPVGRRKIQARKFAEKIAKNRGFPPQPIENLGRKLTHTFWGNAWCENLESYSDYANRLPRGQTYARNGSIADLVVTKGKVNAIVGGSDVYEIEIKFSLLKNKNWKEFKQKCSGSIESAMALLQGRFDESVMADLSRQNGGLFPTPREIQLDCDCPDWAGMCKHIAAVLYGVGARLDIEPEMLFLLRGVDHLELVTSPTSVDSLLEGADDSELAGQDLGQIFGIELDTGQTEEPQTQPVVSAKKKTAKAKSAKKKTVKKKSAKTSAISKTVVRKKDLSKKVAKKKTPSVKKGKTTATKKKSAKKKGVKRKDVEGKTAKKKSTKKKAVRKKATARKPVKKK